jgi:hypothetical protein
MVKFDFDSHVRLAGLERSVREAGDDVKERFEKLERFHQRFLLLRGRRTTTFFTDLTLRQNVTLLKDMEGSALHDRCLEVVVLQRKIRYCEKKIEPAVDRAKVLLQEYLELKRYVHINFSKVN